MKPSFLVHEKSGLADGRADVTSGLLGNRRVLVVHLCFPCLAQTVQALRLGLEKLAEVGDVLAATGFLWNLTTCVLHRSLSKILFELLEDIWRLFSSGFGRYNRLHPLEDERVRWPGLNLFQRLEQDARTQGGRGWIRPSEELKREQLRASSLYWSSTGADPSRVCLDLFTCMGKGGRQMVKERVHEISLHTPPLHPA